MVTPTKIDITFLAAQYEANSLEECLPLFKLVDHSSPAGLVIITSIANLTIVETKLLPLCGFSSISHVVLTDEPQSADITDSPIIVFAVKGTKLKPQFPKKGTWFKIGHERINEVDAIEAAKATFPSLGKRLHVFAERPSDGWSSLIGEKSWVELPSLK